MGTIIRTRRPRGRFPGREATPSRRGRSVAGMSAPVTLERSSFGDLVRYWRRVRAMSQLDLATAACDHPPAHELRGDRPVPTQP